MDGSHGRQPRLHVAGRPRRSTAFAPRNIAAATKLLTPLVLFGQCVMLERGETLSGYVVPNGWPFAWGSKWVSVRHKGTPADYIVAKDKLEAQ